MKSFFFLNKEEFNELQCLNFCFSMTFYTSRSDSCFYFYIHTVQKIWDSQAELVNEKLNRFWGAFVEV